MLYWYHFTRNGRRISVEMDDVSIAGHFLHLLHGSTPSTAWVEAMETSLILYAEHEFNASTFTARVIAGTGSDMHSAITGAIGALKGPKHGGANDPSAWFLTALRTAPSTHDNEVYEEVDRAKCTENKREFKHLQSNESRPDLTMLLKSEGANLRSNDERHGNSYAVPKVQIMEPLHPFETLDLLLRCCIRRDSSNQAITSQPKCKPISTGKRRCRKLA